MIVYKACIKVIKKRIPALATYFVIFTLLAVVMTSFSVEQFSSDFSELHPNFTVINHGKQTILTEGLTAYLTEHGNPVILEDDSTVIQDALFFHATDYILILPEGFSDQFEQMQTELSPPGQLQTEQDAFPLLQRITTPDSAKGYYMDSLVNQYLNTAHIYKQSAAGISDTQIVQAVSSDLSTQAHVEKKQFGSGQPVPETFHIYNRMYSYIIMILVILCISTILMIFRRPDLNMRNLCTPLKLRSINWQLTLCGCTIAVAAWLLLMLFGFLIYGSALGNTDVRILLLLLLNAFLFMIVSLSIAMLVGMFVHSPNAQNPASNFISLALCFLGGVFVPLEMLGSQMLAAAHFTPTFWYVTALDNICALTLFDQSHILPILQAFLVQLGFAAACFCIALVVSKQKRQSNQGFYTTQTEIEP